ncbi:hypothetical protein [Cellulosimicrobium cellulans]|uniref:Uncharacterized protein n=1 Tax=Cellulosimicrobium cellulans TaxID=1710 RepID=A0A4Y4E127_CELCE|nr:hypothetical protein [Cellulosimicrobium cellulans]GED09724.1 hypothetical protein CCE02nite_17230 [Cellulosimicrobium cellulans]
MVLPVVLQRDPQVRPAQVRACEPAPVVVEDVGADDRARESGVDQTQTQSRLHGRVHEAPCPVERGRERDGAAPPPHPSQSLGQLVGRVRTHTPSAAEDRVHDDDEVGLREPGCARGDEGREVRDGPVEAGHVNSVPDDDVACRQASVRDDACGIEGPRAGRP